MAIEGDFWFHSLSYAGTSFPVPIKKIGLVFLPAQFIVIFYSPAKPCVNDKLETCFNRVGAFPMVSRSLRPTPKGREVCKPAIRAKKLPFEYHWF
jgi:hypothetical protein